MQVLLFLSLLAFALGQSGWTADFTMTSSANNSGTSSGTVKWRWSPNDNVNANTRYLFELKFNIPGTSAKLTELYQYNSVGGYGDVFGQNRFLDEATCSPRCSTTGIPTTASAMPALAPRLLGANYYNNAPTSGGSCVSYNAKTASVVSSFTAIPNTGVICSFTMNDGCITRTFTLTNFVATAPTITRPADCACNSVLDVMLVIDRSASINTEQQKQFRKFFVNFLTSLNIAPNAVNVGMVWFQSRSGTQFQMTGSASDIAIGVSNCSSPRGNTIGACASSPSDGRFPWPTPCSNNDNRLICDGIYTNTASGVLLGANVLYQSNRKVPKLFITMTDGAVNRVISDTNAGRPWTTSLTAGPADDGNCNLITSPHNCTNQIKTVMNVIKAQHTAWTNNVGCNADQCSLTLLSVGIGLPLGADCSSAPSSFRNNYCKANNTVGGTGNKLVCWDNSFCLAPQHLDILAGGTGAWGSRNDNVLQADNWDRLNNEYIPKLVALSCPSGQYAECQCGSNCAGVCASCKCIPPESCVPVDNLCYAVAPTPISNACPKVNKSNPCDQRECNCKECISYVCNPAGNNGRGSCDPLPPAPGTGCAPPAGTQCATTICKADGTCGGVNISRCSPCVNTVTSRCVGASCGVEGTQNITKVRGNGDFCTDEGSNTSQSCCAPCDCSISWSAWSGVCGDMCPSAVALTINRTLTITPATCGGSNTPCQGIPAVQITNCSDCSPKDCEFYWTSWDCNCTSAQANRYFVVVREAEFGGEDCPSSNETQSCSCCQSEWTETECDCDTNTKTRTWARTVLATGGGVDCEEVDPNVTVVSCPVPPQCAICENDDDCDDKDGCTIDICDYVNATGGPNTTEKHCRSIPKICEPSNSVCFTTACDANLGGCVVIPSAASFCDDNNVCTEDWCDDVAGCQYSRPSQIALNCSNDPALNDCNYAFCDPFTGCGVINILCNATADAENCSVAGCDPNWNSTDPDYEPLCNCEEEGGPTGPCYTYSVCYSDIGLVIGLTAGGIAALVVCLAFLAFLILSGGTYAIATQVKTGEDTTMNNNPLYTDKGTHGTNALHAGNLD